MARRGHRFLRLRTRMLLALYSDSSEPDDADASTMDAALIEALSILEG